MKTSQTISEKLLGTYIDPFTDFGFKKIFGSEESKPLLMSFLNDLLPLDEPIVHLEFKNIEKLGMLEEDRKAIFDIYCHDKKGNQFIVELQRAKLSNMSYDNRHEYEISLKRYRDFFNVLDAAKKEGIELGENNQAIKIALNMLKNKVDINLIVEVTELTKTEILKL